MLTGRQHWRDFHGIVNAFGASVFQPARLTLPEMLKQAGYRTAVIGKWHLGWNWDAIKVAGAQPITMQQSNGRKQPVWPPQAFDWSKPIPDGPLAHGFDYYFGDTVINFPPYCWIENDRVVQAPDTLMDSSKWKEVKEGGWECRPGPMVTGWDPYQVLPTLTAKGVQYIHEQARDGQPFFLYFAFPSPHAPIIPNDAFDGRSQAGPYGDFVCETDHCCGQLLDALEAAGLADDTIVIFTADNGPERYAYARDQAHDHWSAGPLRGLKRDIYEGGHRVPFILRWPGLTKPGTVSQALVSQIDIMATLAAHLQFPLPVDAAEDSHDLLPLLHGETPAVRTTHVHNTSAGKYALRDGPWLLIASQHGYGTPRDRQWEAKHHYPPDDQQAVELYDLTSDVAQRRNVADEHPDRVIAMQALLERIRTQGYSAPRLSQ
jgi:arylsulfatase A